MSTRSTSRRVGALSAAAVLVVVPSATAAHGAAAQGLSARAAAVADPLVPVFSGGMAQPVFTDAATWVRQELWVETGSDSDGDGAPDRVHVDVTRPGETESDGLQVPVVYETSPYYAGGNPAENWSVDHELGELPDPPPYLQGPAVDTAGQISTSLVGTWVPRGFAVVHSEAPGTGLSQGCPTTGGENEAEAPVAVVDWLNGRATGWTSAQGGEQVDADWSTGSVGMTGTSYNGTLPVMAAASGVEGLEAIIPVAAISEWYEYYRDNGLVRAAGGYQGEDADVLAHYVHTRADRQVCAPVIEELAVQQDRVTGDYGDFWEQRSSMADVEQVEAATLVAHGLSDWNVKPSQGIDLYEALRDQGTPAQLYLHQGGHGGAPPDAMMNRWFTRYLFDVENGVELDPPAWITREGAPRLQPTPYDSYPLPGSEPALLGLGAGGRASGPMALLEPGEGGEVVVDEPRTPVQELAAAPSSPGRLLYQTPELVEPLHLSGTPEVTVRMAADRAAVNLSVAVVATDADGGVDVVTRGWADPQNHADLRGVGQPLVPGEEVDVTFALEPDDTVVPAGHRLGLVVLQSDADYTIRPAGGAEVTVDLAGSGLTLPVVGGPLALAEGVDDVGGYAVALVADRAGAGLVPPTVAARATSALQSAQRLLDRGAEAQAERRLDQVVDVLTQVEDAAVREQLLEVVEALRPGV